MSRTIRVWKLGSLEHGIMPTQEAVDTLTELLAAGASDIIWGPDIQVFTVVVDDGDEHKVESVEINRKIASAAFDNESKRGER